MPTYKSGVPASAEHLIERQMLLRDVKRRLLRERPVKRGGVGSFRFLTISRDVGSLGDEVAAQLSNRLEWHVYDREIVDSIAKERRTRQSLVQQLDEKSQNLVEDTVRRLLGMAQGASLGREDYHGALIRTLVVLGAGGEAIMMGRGANFVLRDQPGLHLRVVASEEVRVGRLCERWSLAPEKARLQLRKIDTERRRFIRRYFKQDINDPRFYDLVFNTDHLPLGKVVDAIIACGGVH